MRIFTAEEYAGGCRLVYNKDVAQARNGITVPLKERDGYPC